MYPLTLATALILVVFAVGSSHAGSPCPPYETVKPCFCSVDEDLKTSMVCAGVNRTMLLQVTSAIKSMVVDRFMILGAFHEKSILNYLVNYDIDPEEDTTPEDSTFQKLPEKWLSGVRVKAVEIQKSALSSCFLCDDPFSGQSVTLTSLVTTNCELRGHLCSVCNPKIAHTPTKELLKAPGLKYVDFSYNVLRVLSGYSFPDLKYLKTVILSNNMIMRIHDKAFSNLPQLNELDLSHNLISSISRKIFRDPDSTLKVLDLSWNSLQYLPDDMFLRFRYLREVKLNNNLFETISETPFSQLPSTLEKVDFRNNFIVCNCSLSWVSRRLPKNTKLVTRCIAPKEVELQDFKTNLVSMQSC